MPTFVRTSEFGQITPNVLARQGTPDYTGVNLHTSVQSIPIPIMWGSRRISPNIIWVGPDAQSAAHSLWIVAPDLGGDGWTLGAHPSWGVPIVTWTTVATGGWFGQVNMVGGAGGPPGGGPTTGTFAYGDTSPGYAHWWYPTVLGLCEGPINAISRMWNGGGSLYVPVNWTGGVAPVSSLTYGPNLNPASIYYTLFLGTSSQTPWGYYAAADAVAGGPFYANQHLAYRFTAYIASAVMDWGRNNTPPQQSFEVIRTPNNAYRVADSYGIAYDYNAADFIPDLLESAQYGVGFTGADFDAGSLLQFAAYIFAQGLMLSPLLDSQTPIVDLINRWAILTNSWIFCSGVDIVFAELAP